MKKAHSIVGFFSMFNDSFTPMGTFRSTNIRVYCIIQIFFEKSLLFFDNNIVFSKLLRGTVNEPGTLGSSFSDGKSRR